MTTTINQNEHKEESEKNVYLSLSASEAVYLLHLLSKVESSFLELQTILKEDLQNEKDDSKRISTQQYIEKISSRRQTIHRIMLKINSEL